MTRDKSAPCKQEKHKVGGSSNFTFTLMKDGAASFSNKENRVELSCNQVLDIYDDLTRFYSQFIEDSEEGEEND